MLLSKEDIERISKAGFKDFFSIDENGYILLKNLPANPPHCIFFEETTKDCKIYAIRPRGCQFYPLILEMDDRHCIIDDYCPLAPELKIDANECQELIQFGKIIVKERDVRISKDEDKLEKAKIGFQSRIQDYRKDDVKKQQVEDLLKFLQDKKQISFEEIAQQLNLPKDYVQVRVEELIIHGRLPGYLKGELYISE